MYLRFQTIVPDPQSGRPTGILVVAHELRDSNRISTADEKWLRDYLAPARIAGIDRTGNPCPA